MKSSLTKKECLEAIKIINERLIEAVEEGFFFEVSIDNPVYRFSDTMPTGEPTGEMIINISIDPRRKVEYE